MDPCVTCGTTEETTAVCTCDCQCLETARQSGCREIKLIAPTRDTATAWAENDPIVPEGVFFLVKDRLFEGSLEYAIGDGESKYSELSMLYAGAPLSRTGAANHSPLAASGESTLDPSWLPDATSSAKGAVMTSTTGAAGKVPIAASGATALDPSWLPAATSSALGGVMTSTTGASDKVPIADSNGKLDPSWLPEATSTTLGGVKASTTKAGDNVVKADANGGLGGWKDAISDAVANPSAGLVKNSDGTLGVDFNQMPTTKFEALLKSLKMLVPLEANLDLYVDKNHSASGDSIVDGRGTQAMPFKTIQAAVNFVTQTYAINSHSVYIKVSNATYDECLTLPVYSRTTGAINIEAWDYNNPPTLHASSTWAYAILVIGGPWYLKRFNITGNYVIPETDVPVYNALVRVAGTGAQLYVYGCSAWAEVTGNAQSVFTRCNLYEVDFNGTLEFSVLTNYPNTFHLVKGNVMDSCVFQITHDSALNVYDINTNSAALSMPCSGSCTTFCDAFANGKFTCVFGSLYHPEFTGTMTGKKYKASTSGAIEAPTN